MPPLSIFSSATSSSKSFGRKKPEEWVFIMPPDCWAYNLSTICSDTNKSLQGKPCGREKKQKLEKDERLKGKTFMLVIMKVPCLALSMPRRGLQLLIRRPAFLTVSRGTIKNGDICTKVTGILKQKAHFCDLDKLCKLSHSFCVICAVICNRLFFLCSREGQRSYSGHECPSRRNLWLLEIPAELHTHFQTYCP